MVIDYLKKRLRLFLNKINLRYYRLEKTTEEIYRYKFIKRFAVRLIKYLNLDEMTNINLSESIFYKLAGYYVFLDNVVSKIINKDFRIILYRNLLISTLIEKFRKTHERKYEIHFKYNLPQKEINLKYKNIYFVTMNNYLNPIIFHIEKQENYLLILPYESKNWINYQEIIKKKIVHVFLEEIIDISKEKVHKLKKFILSKYSLQRKKIQSLLLGIRNKASILQYFIANFLPLHILIAQKFEEVLINISLRETNFYIARDRRGLENAFIQIANKINGNTNMLIHGMISFDFRRRLWTEGRFKNCKNIFVWGLHDKDVINRRQLLLKERLPNIIISGNPFIQKINNITNESIVFLSQPFTNIFIPYLSRIIPAKLNCIVRLHPGDRDLISNYKMYERENFKFDNLKEPLIKTLSKASMAICYSSTSILEAIYNEIPTLILDFKELCVKYSTIFKESPISSEELSEILVNRENLEEKILKITEDKNFKQKILEVNRNLFNYFITTTLPENIEGF